MHQPSSNFFKQVYHVVQRIPPGKVTSYGRIAAMLGHPRAARAVGYALSNLKSANSAAPYTSSTVPWQRVINSQGRISIHHREATAQKQAQLLREERVTVSDNLRIDLSIYLWEGLHLIEIDDILQQSK
jgi:methylated-DNA-protein-cysteine methyltransferase related protein